MSSSGIPGAPITVGIEPDQIAITPNGEMAYVTDFGGSTATAINTATGIVGATIKVGSHPDGIAITPNGSLAFVANSGSGNVTPITVAGNTPGSPIKVGTTPEAGRGNTERFHPVRGQLRERNCYARYLPRPILSSQPSQSGHNPTPWR